MMVSEANVLGVLKQIESGDITLTPLCDLQERIKGGGLYRANNDWTIEVSNCRRVCEDWPKT